MQCDEMFCCSEDNVGQEVLKRKIDFHCTRSSEAKKQVKVNLFQGKPCSSILMRSSIFTKTRTLD